MRTTQRLQRRDRRKVPDHEAAPPQNGALRRQPTAPGVHERQPVVARVVLENGAERAATVQLHRDGAERLGGRGGADLAGGGQRNGREGDAAKALQETLC